MKKAFNTLLQRMPFALSAKYKFNAEMNHFATIYSLVVNSKYWVNFKKVLNGTIHFRMRSKKFCFFTLLWTTFGNRQVLMKL